MNDTVYAYYREVALREPESLARLRARTAALPAAGMQICPEQGQLMAMLVRLLGARRCLEVGTFTGYSALAVALALPHDGVLVCCDVSEEWTAIARDAWADAGVSDRVDLRLAPAADTLDELLRSGAASSFDLAFVDADKEGYDAYYERALKLLRPGGVVAIDNVIWSGRPADPGATDASTRAIRALNAKIHADSRVDMVMLPIGDGLTLARRRE